MEQLELSGLIPSLDLGSLRQSICNLQSLETIDTTIDESGYGIQYDTEVFKGRDLCRSDTRNTFLPDFPNKPDITLKCEKCDYFVNIANLREHRKYHASLLTLKYKGGTMPNEVNELFRRRNQLIKKLKKMATDKSPLEPQQIQHINDAYEYIKSHLEDTYEEFRQVVENVDTDVNGVALNCSPACVNAVGIASSNNKRWKSAMEDTHVYQDCFGEDADKCYLGIFDGYNGHFAAEAAAMELHRILLNEMRKFDPNTKLTSQENRMWESVLISDRAQSQESERRALHEESVNLVQQIIDMCEEKYQQIMGNHSDESQKQKSKNKSKFKNPFSERISEAFKKSYQLFDILLSYGKDERSKVRWSGCSSLNMVIQNTSKGGNSDEINSKTSQEPLRELGLIHVANAGNVHGLLVRGNRSYRLTKDHTPRNTRERARILKAGCSVNGDQDCRVNGILSTTRGLGNHGDLKLKKSVLVEPYTTCIPIDQYAQFLVMASNGVWEMFSDEEVASMLLKLLPCNEFPAPSPISESVELLMMNKDDDEDSLMQSSSTLKNNICNSTKENDVLQNNSDQPKELMTIAADLKTEVGSHCGDDLDTILHDSEMISEPVNCNIPDHTPQSRSDFQRELAKSMAEYLVQAALLAGARDNITVMVTLFPGSGF